MSTLDNDLRCHNDTTNVHAVFSGYKSKIVVGCFRRRWRGSEKQIEIKIGIEREGGRK